jgi:predicted GIY-YIG superfamily endonuclease
MCPDSITTKDFILYQVKLKRDPGPNYYYYIGITQNYEYRKQQHLEGRGSAWLRECFTTEDRSKAQFDIIGSFISEQNARNEETLRTLALMVEHGCNNVRGAEYCLPRDYDQSQIDGIAYAVNHHLSPVYEFCCDITHVKFKLRQNSYTGER